MAFEFGDPFPRDLVLGNEYARETPPVTLPPDCGAKVVVRLTLCPGASVVGMPSPTVSHHLDQLRRAGLVQARRQERFIYYSVGTPMVNDLVRILTACC